MRLIDADMLIERMYHDAFETDTDMQKWDSGCWIRYKMFENAIFSATTIDAVSVVRCKEYRFYIADEGKCTRSTWVYDWHRPKTNADDFCSYGERRE